MARYTGPRRRIVRRLGVPLPGLTHHTSEDRDYPPGQHGLTRLRRQRRLSDYAVRLREKQRLRHNYGLRETQMRRYVYRAAHMPGPTGVNLLSLLERRLDNAVFRLGLAPTIPAARQIVRHGHIRVNERRVDIPSYLVSPGDHIDVRPESRKHLHVAEGAERGPTLELPSYLSRDADGFGGRVTAGPDRRDVPVEVDERLVVEFYAR